MWNWQKVIVAGHSHIDLLYSNYSPCETLSIAGHSHIVLLYSNYSPCETLSVAGHSHIDLLYSNYHRNVFNNFKELFFCFSEQDVGHTFFSPVKNCPYNLS